MIKIDSFYEQRCKVLFEVESMRPARVYEPELGLAVAKKLTDYFIDPHDGKIYYSPGSIDLEHSIGKLKEIQQQAQEKFSQRIQKLKNQVNQFKLLQELTKKKPVKKEE